MTDKSKDLNEALRLIFLYF